MKRLFFAVMLPASAHTDALRVQTRLRAAMGAEGLRWSGPEQMHVTLKFLGDVDEAQIALVEEAGAQAAMQAGAFRLGLGGVGVFPAQRNPQTLWLGIAGDVPLLTRLAECLEREIAERGFAPESKPYRPHLTLARAKTRDGEEMIAKTLPTLRDADLFGSEPSAFEVADFALIHSELRQSGPLYTVLKTFALGAETE